MYKTTFTKNLFRKPLTSTKTEAHKKTITNDMCQYMLTITKSMCQVCKRGLATRYIKDLKEDLFCSINIMKVL